MKTENTNDLFYGENYTNGFVNKAEIITGSASKNEQTGEWDYVIYDSCIENCSDVILYMDIKYDLMKNLEDDFKLDDLDYDYLDPQNIDIQCTVHFNYKPIDEKSIDNNKKYLIITQDHDIFCVWKNKCYSMGSTGNNITIDDINFSIFIGDKDKCLEKIDYDVFKVVE